MITALAAIENIDAKTLNSSNAVTPIGNVTPPLGELILSVKNKPIQQVLKRVFDIALSLTTIIALAPLFLVLIILIKKDSKGPALFKQVRVGLKGKHFHMYKFRSMVEDADEQFDKVKKLNNTNPVMFKSKKDPRITNIGKFIRRYSLDELPQVLNVLRGEMSLVGPRPPVPRELRKYKQWHHVRFLAAPGLTGLWQVSGRATIKDFDKVVSLDYEYIKNWNLLFDFRIILKTVPVVLSGKGAG